MKRMRRVTNRAALGAACVLVLASAPAAAQVANEAHDTFSWSGQLSPGQAVEIRGVNGSVEAGPSSSGQVEISAVKRGRRSDPKLVKVEVVPHAGGVTVCAVYPAPPGEQANRCEPGGGRSNTKDNDVRVDFTVRVPAGANLVARTVNGGIEARDLDGAVDLTTVNGGVKFDTQGIGRAKTVNGSITGRVGRSDWSEALKLETVNGSITLDLPGGTDATVEARTVNGRIQSDLPLTLIEANRRSLKGTLGAGGRTLSISTVNGSIHLKSGA